MVRKRRQLTRYVKVTTKTPRKRSSPPTGWQFHPLATGVSRDVHHMIGKGNASGNKHAGRKE
jgi:hypothetical protein